MNKDEIVTLIKELVEKTKVKLNKITVTEEDGANTWFSVEVSEPHFFIEREGEALHALNYLVRRIIESRIISASSLGNFPQPGAGENRQSSVIFIDINDFQKKRVEAIRAVAHMMGERARYFKSSIEVDPMSAFERRIVHEFLSNTIDLKTESVGFGPTRRVVIKYVGNI